MADNKTSEAKTVSGFEFILGKDKETPGTWRYGKKFDDGHSVSIYLTNDQVAKLGKPASIKVHITKS